MTIAYRADPSLGCTTSVWDGSIGADDVEQHLIALAGDAEWPPGPLHLTDLTTIGDATIPDPQLVALLYEGTNLPEELKVAVVVRPEFLGRPELRFASETEEMRGATFTEIADACAYLGVSVAEIAATIEALRTELRRQQT